MRYFFRFENSTQQSARRLFACGVCAMELGLLLSLIAPRWIDLVFFVDLFACVLLFCGALIWNRREMKTAALFFAGAFVLRAVLACIRPTGLFSFLVYVPFSVCVLIGEMLVLEKLGRHYQRHTHTGAGEEKKDPFEKAETVLLRSEVSLWIAVLLTYLSDLLLFPAFLMFLWVIGVRAWVSYLVFTGPHGAPGLSLREYGSRVRTQ